MPCPDVPGHAVPSRARPRRAQATPHPALSKGSHGPPRRTSPRPRHAAPQPADAAWPRLAVGSPAMTSQSPPGLATPGTTAPKPRGAETSTATSRRGEPDPATPGPAGRIRAEPFDAPPQQAKPCLDSPLPAQPGRDLAHPDKTSPAPPVTNAPDGSGSGSGGSLSRLPPRVERPGENDQTAPRAEQPDPPVRPLANARRTTRRRRTHQTDRYRDFAHRWRSDSGTNGEHSSQISAPTNGASGIGSAHSVQIGPGRFPICHCAYWIHHVCRETRRGLSERTRPPVIKASAPAARKTSRPRRVRLGACRHGRRDASTSPRPHALRSVRRSSADRSRSRTHPRNALDP
jgi:hypothetical protein